MTRALPLLPLLVGCSGPFVTVEGQIGDLPFDKALTAFHGGPHIILFEEEVDCLNADFLQRAYDDGIPPTDLPFVALQFSAMDEDSYAPGTYVFEPNSPVRSYGLQNTEEGSFVTYRGREGTLTITDMDEKKEQWIEGEFDVAFTDSEVHGTFRTEFCRNVQP